MYIHVRASNWGTGASAGRDRGFPRVRGYGQEGEDEGPRATSSEQAWPGLSKVFEVDLLVRPRCRVAMEVVACITDPAVIDAILRHRREAGLVSPFEARAPPEA